MSINFDDLTREDLFELIGKLTEMAAERDDSRPARASDRTTQRDPLVRSLAAAALVELIDKKKLSFREVATMFNVTHSRVHQLYQDLVASDEAKERKRA